MVAELDEERLLVKLLDYRAHLTARKPLRREIAQESHDIQNRGTAVRALVRLHRSASTSQISECSRRFAQFRLFLTQHHSPRQCKGLSSLRRA
jgi:hypothetical protein